MRLYGWVLELFWDFCSFSYFCGLFRLLGWLLGAVLVISAVSATFAGSFRLLGWVWGAVLVISAVSATFVRLLA